MKSFIDDIMPDKQARDREKESMIIVTNHSIP